MDDETSGYSRISTELSLGWAHENPALAHEAMINFLNRASHFPTTIFDFSRKGFLTITADREPIERADHLNVTGRRA